MSSKQFRKTIREIVNENPSAASALIFDELQNILDQPPLPADHPGAAAQRRAKSSAQAALGDIQVQLPALAGYPMRSAAAPCGHGWPAPGKVPGLEIGWKCLV
jgi:hypothetical protein